MATKNCQACGSPRGHRTDDGRMLCQVCENAWGEVVLAAYKRFIEERRAALAAIKTDA